MWQKAICQKAYVVCHPSREEILDSLPPPHHPSVGHRCFKTISGTFTKRPSSFCGCSWGCGWGVQANNSDIRPQFNKTHCIWPAFEKQQCNMQTYNYWGFKNASGEAAIELVRFRKAFRFALWLELTLVKRRKSTSQSWSLLLLIDIRNVGGKL